MLFPIIAIAFYSLNSATSTIRSDYFKRDRPRPRQKSIQSEDYDREDLQLSYSGPPHTRQFGAYRTCRKPGQVLLSMDDGPSPNMNAVIDIWNKKKVPGVFFVLGRHLDKNDPHWLQNRKALKRAYSMGYEIGSHGFSHTPLDQLSDDQIRQEMNDTAKLIYQVIGKYPILMREPDAVIDKRIMSILTNQLGYKVVEWNRDTNDWKYPETYPDHTIRYIGKWIKRENRRRESYIVLAHDHVRNTVQSLPRAIDIIESRDYRFVSAKQCLGLSSVYRNYLYGKY